VVEALLSSVGLVGLCFETLVVGDSVDVEVALPVALISEMSEAVESLGGVSFEELLEDLDVLLKFEVDALSWFLA
jgi:hypothetical protein